ncbi:aminotransferase class III-fold pyridoxal phosphate-dependent enzyme [uncultured Herbaspirillum sp.]|uniref:aspartate aminotransferase family protein n=1 Tax=uncultured Herbaspirillum sp. TaxID=160236 RepID=UPI00262CF376|nr:aminotransferase class III-fold pyridoxal phosphate-dependent enzyme [uncultured Herbaspirillum sp.]
MDIAIILAAAIIGLLLFRKVYIRLRLSRAKHPSLSGHAKMSRRMARLTSFFDYGPERYFSTDLAPAEVEARRRAGMERLRKQFAEGSPRTLAYGESLEPAISDVQFTSRYRVPFPFSRGLPREFRYGSVVTQTQGTRLRDLDGNWKYDVSGSYGVNVFGYDFYKECLAAGYAAAAELGPVLGPYHLAIADNVAELKRISGLDEVSFHMSGTEAVMQAVRLARYHTGRTHLVRLCGAYHGWWDGVQPGVGNQRRVDDVYTLADMSPRTLKVLKTRKDIACVLINPFQALHPNADAPGDASLVNSQRRTAFDRAAYSRWLAQLREVCTRRGIVMISDEVFAGFRLGHRGAQEYFGYQADMVTYGKTLGGGLPVAAFGGRAEVMKHLAPLGGVYQAGTLSGNPVTVAAGMATLKIIQQPDFYELLAAQTRKLTDGLSAAAKAAGVRFAADAIGGMFGLYFDTKVPTSYAEVMQGDKERFNRFFHKMLDAGVYFAPSAFEAGFVSAQHSDAIIEETIAAAAKAFTELG